MCSRVSGFSPVGAVVCKLSLNRQHLRGTVRDPGSTCGSRMLGVAEVRPQGALRLAASQCAFPSEEMNPSFTVYCVGPGQDMQFRHPSVLNPEMRVMYGKAEHLMWGLALGLCLLLASLQCASVICHRCAQPEQCSVWTQRE